MSRWGVSVRNLKVHKMVVYDNFKEAKRVALATKQKYQHRPDVVVELISRSRAFPPPSHLKKRRGEWWCPYCCKPRLFYWDDRLGLKKCPVCGISDHDYYVRTYNHLWHRTGKRRG